MWSGRPQRHKWATCWEPQLGRSAKIDWQRHFKTKDSASGLLHSRCIFRGLRVCVCVYQPDDFSGGIGSAEFPLMGSTGPHTHTYTHRHGQRVLEDDLSFPFMSIFSLYIFLERIKKNIPPSLQKNVGVVWSCVFLEKEMRPIDTCTCEKKNNQKTGATQSKCSPRRFSR